MAQPVKVTILGDASGAKRAFKEVEDGAKRTQGKLSKLRSGFSNVGSSMRNIGKTATLGVTAPIVGGLVLATKAAIDENKEMAVLAQTMRNTVGATDEQVAAMERFVTQTQNATGVSDGELRPALGKLLQAGLDTAQAQDALGTALDIAAARGMPVETVTKAIGKAAQGTTGGMGRLGLATKDAAGHALSFEQIMASANDVYGGAAQNAADTTSGRMAILKVKFDDMVETVGNAFIPIVEKAVGWVGKAAEFFTNLSPKVQQIALVVALVVAAIGPLVFIGGALATAIGALLSPIGLVIIAIVALVAGVIYAYKRFQGFRDAVAAVVDFIMGTVWPAIQRFAAYFMEQLGHAVDWVRSIWPQVSEAIGHVMTVVATITRMVLTVIMGLWHAVGDDILSAVMRAFNMIQGVISAVLQVIRGVITTVLALINGDWGKAWDGIKNIVAGVWNAIWAVISGALGIILSTLGAAFSLLGNLFNAGWSVLTSIVSAVFRTIVGVVSSQLGIIFGFIGSIPGRLLGFVGGILGAAASIGRAIIDGIKSGITAAGGFMGDVVDTITGAIKGAINGVIDTVNGLLPNSFGPFDLPDDPIPRLRAMGGPASGWTTVGERGPETVLLPRGSMVVPAHASAAGGQTINVNVQTNADPYAIARRVAWALKTTGR